MTRLLLILNTARLKPTPWAEAIPAMLQTSAQSASYETKASVLSQVGACMPTSAQPATVKLKSTGLLKDSDLQEANPTCPVVHPRRQQSRDRNAIGSYICMSNIYTPMVYVLCYNICHTVYHAGLATESITRASQIYMRCRTTAQTVLGTVGGP